MKNSVDLTEFVDHGGQPGLVAVSVPLVDEVLGSGTVENTGGLLEFLERFILVILIADSFDSRSHTGTKGPISDPVLFGGSHPFGAGLMIRQRNILSKLVTKLDP
jgi:hypothetical protein